MITFLDGTLVEKQPMRVVLDVGGVGYEVHIPLSSYDNLPSLNERCKMLTYDNVREDQHDLYGFRTEPERAMFMLLLEVNGIGPKIALAALSGISLRELAGSIASGDVKRLGSIPGIGRKKAERMVVELKDKISRSEALGAVAGAEAAEAGQDVRLGDAIMALVSLGYKQAEASAMVKKIAASVSMTDTAEDVIRRALSNV